MKHLIRAAVILVAIVAITVLLPRLIPLVKTQELQSFGFYSGKDNTDEIMQLPVKYADPIRCNDCHADKHGAWSTSVHQTVSCENCHGPAEVHIVTGVDLPINSSPSLCETCHSKLLARPDGFPQVDIAIHGEAGNCISCHNPHAPFIPIMTHKVEGRSDCLLCHQPGGLKPVSDSHKGRTLDSCFRCHNNSKGI